MYRYEQNKWVYGKYLTFSFNKLMKGLKYVLIELFELI